MSTFWTPERLSQLEAEALEWVGTPFGANSSAKGVGVSCQKLAAALYSACGYPDVLDVPDVPMSHARFSTVSFVVDWFANRPDFNRLEGAPIQPGDVLGFRIGHTVHHLGVALSDGRFVHAMDGMGATISLLADATWESRLTYTWRPNA